MFLKHFWCEKPITMTLEESKSLVKQSNKANLTLAEGFMYLHHPQFFKVQNYVHDYEAGQVHSVTCRFGIPILEALFSKTPVITSKGGCFTETGGPKSKYINPLSSKEIRNAIQEIQSSKDLQKIMKEEGFKYAQKFTDKNIANNLHDLYNKL